MKDFVGFRFGNIHSEDLHLVVVSSGNRYEKNLLPDPNDYSSDVPGGDGQYYWGQTYKTREFTVNVAFDNVSEQIFRKISQIFSTDKPQDLVFDEMPFKTYRAKLRSKPDFKTICFTNRDTGERVYKGEGTLNFICYYPYAFGFNKYVVRAADYYKCLQPKEIITRSIVDNPYKKNKRPKMLTGLIKDHYNVEPNMHTPWKGGYPAKEQVQWGELYFKDPQDDTRKLIIDVRGYWDNIPEWQGTARLLTTPTLDFDRELIYCPQYSKTNYYNMDIGLNQQNGLIGSRILVYNPGDLPVDFELRLGNISSDFRKNLNNYTFRVSRYNVERLTIPEAVDFTGLKTLNKEDNEPYKYGNRYFYIMGGADDSGAPAYNLLKNSHPHHTYIVEPIPKERLGYFIRLFYYQSSLIEDGMISNIIDFEEGKMIANRYEELYNECINDHERYELYWETLKMAILDKYKEVDEYLKTEIDPKMGIFSDVYTFEDFCYDYIYNPPEYIRERVGLKYGQFIFNLTRIPSYYTFDYFDINNEGFNKIKDGCCYCDDCCCSKDIFGDRASVKPLYLNTEKHMLYHIVEPEWRDPRSKAGRDLLRENPNLEDNFFEFKPSKKILNDNIIKGHWFKLPPGWSMIDISPVIDEDIWGGKRWLDSRPFIWGVHDEKYQDGNEETYRQHFDKVYRRAAEKYLSENIPLTVLSKYSTKQSVNEPDDTNRGMPEDVSPAGLKQYFESLELYQLEDYMQFRRWYEGNSGYDFYGNMEESYLNELLDENEQSLQRKDSLIGLGYEIWRKKVESAEYGFLKTLADYWRANRVDDNCNCVGDIDEWWWYACNYIWANFPPLYWGYADLLNKAQIKYVPLFY